MANEGGVDHIARYIATGMLWSMFNNHKRGKKAEIELPTEFFNKLIGSNGQKGTLFRAADAKVTKKQQKIWKKIKGDLIVDETKLHVASSYVEKWIDKACRFIWLSMNSRARLVEEAQINGPKDYQRRIREDVLNMEITKDLIQTIDSKWLTTKGGGLGGDGSQSQRSKSAGPRGETLGHKIMKVWIGKIMNTRGKQVLMADQPIAEQLQGTHRAQLKSDAYRRAMINRGKEQDKKRKRENGETGHSGKSTSTQRKKRRRK